MKPKREEIGIDRYSLLPVVYLLGTALWIWIVVNLPYTWDDWDWGSAIGIRYLLNGSQNSRYMGNILEILMTRSQLFKNVILSLTYAGIPILSVSVLKKITGATEREQMVFYLAINTLILQIGPQMWCQTYGWVAGAANFVISYLFILIYLNVVIRIIRGVSDSSAFSILSSAVFGVSMELFIENVALFGAFVTALIFVYLWLIKKQHSFSILALLIGNIIGLGLMFSSSIYGTLIHTGKAIDGYRSLAFEIGDPLVVMVMKSGAQFVGKYIPLIYGTYAIIPATVCFLGLLFLSLRQKKKSILCVTLSCISMVIMGCLITNTYFGVPIPFAGNPYRYLIYGIMTADVLFVLGLLEIYLIFIEAGAKRNFLLCLWVAVPAVVAPLCVTMESGPRVFFTSTEILILVSAFLLREIYINSSLKIQKTLLAICFAGIVMLGIKWVPIYSSIGSTTRQRLQAISELQQDEPGVITLERYEYEELLWNPDGSNGNQSFREFYHISPLAEVVYIPHS